MRTKLVIVSDRCTPEDREAITVMLKTEVGWWHWFEHAWLIVDVKGHDPSWWVGKLRRVAPDSHFFVVNVNGGSWAGVGRKNAFQWLRDEW